LKNFHIENPITAKSIEGGALLSWAIEIGRATYRCKGIVFTAESPEMRYALQAVGRRVEIIELGDWGEHTPQSGLVAIGSSFDA
jgi:G3E family GTPase